MEDIERQAIALVAQHIGIGGIPFDWSGIDAVLPLLERMRIEGAVVLLKLDGERRGPADSPPYTVAVLGSRMNDDPIRYDTTSLEQGLTRIIVEYARRFWCYPAIS
jgi:hypothetical protein